jgi:hypothetical protein
MPKMENCGFCGTRPKGFSSFWGSWLIVCPKCMFTWEDGSRDDAVKMWNELNVIPEEKTNDADEPV